MIVRDGVIAHLAREFGRTPTVAEVDRLVKSLERSNYRATSPPLATRFGKESK